MIWSPKFLHEYIESSYLFHKEKVENKYIGLILPIITIGLYALIYAFTGPLMIGYFGIFGVVVAIATFIAGARTGMICTAISIVYLITPLAYNMHHKSFSNTLLISFNGFLLLATVGIIEVIRRKIKNTFRRLMEEQEEIKKAGENILTRDIARREQVEETLRLSEEKYRSLVEQLPDAVYVHKDGQMYYVNKAAVKLFGMEKAEDILGRNMVEFVIVAKEFEEMNLYRKVQRGKGAVELPLWTYKLDRYDGETIDVEGLSMPIIIDGKPGVQFVVRDISERKKMEAIQKKAEREMELYKEIVEYDRIKTEFFANMSHEIRTPLNLILSALQLMNMNIKDKKAIEEVGTLTRYTDIMKQNCYRLLRLVNNLIEITKLDSGYIRPNFKNQNIVCLVEDIVLSVADYVEDKSLSLSFDTNEEEMTTSCDADMLERIILNLLSNAIKYTEPGDHIDVIMDIQSDKVKIHVKDSGRGIPEDKQKIVFERFRQVDKLLTRTTEGSGIGLSLVKGLVEVQGGAIYLNSKHGEGSEFIIELPVRKLEYDENSFEEVAACQSQERIERINIEFSDIYE